MWKCPVCEVPCQDHETQCPACETPKPGTESNKPKDLGPPIQFGLGTTGTTPIFGGLSAVPLPTHNPFAQAGPISFGGIPLATQQQEPTDGSRFTFGRSDPLAVCEPATQPLRPSTPMIEKGFRSPTTFCAAMETPAPAAADGPLLLDAPSNFKVNVSAASLLAAEEGAVYTWGSGECDQLAVRSEHIDDDGVRRTPIIIKRLAKPIATRVCCGTMHSAAIVDGGKALYTWGCNDEGALGRPCKTHQLTVDTWVSVPAPDEGPERHHAKVPAPIWGLPENTEIRGVSAGDSHTCVVSTSGDCYCWGAYRDSWGPIGFPLWDGRHTPKQTVPTKVPGLKGSAMELVSGENHTGVMTYSSQDKKERIYLWGSNDFAQLGLEPSTAVDEHERRKGFLPVEWTIEKFEFKYPAPRKDENEATVLLPHPDNAALKSRGSLLRLFAGRCTTFFTVDLNGEARTFGFGRNGCGELGCGSSEPYIRDPVEVLALKGCRFKDIKGGDWFTLALSHDGSVFSWGHREYVGLGPKMSQNVLKPTLIPGLKQKVRAIGAGSKTAYVLTMDGRLFAWGDNQVAQMGNGTDCDDPVLLPTYVGPDFFSQGYVIDIAGGAQHAIALVKQFAQGELSTARGEKRRRDLEIEEDPHEDKKPRVSKQADSMLFAPLSLQRPAAPPPTPVFPLTDDSARPTRTLPEDLADDTVVEEPPQVEEPPAEDLVAEEEEPDSVPHIKRPLPAPAEPASPVLTSAAKRLKAEVEERHLDEFGDDPGHDADVSNNLEASQIEEDCTIHTSDVEAAAEGSTVVPPTVETTVVGKKPRAKAKARAAPKKRTVSEKEAIDNAEAEEELNEAPVQRATRRKAAAPKKQATKAVDAPPKRRARTAKNEAPPPPPTKRVTRARAAAASK